MLKRWFFRECTSAHGTCGHPQGTVPGNSVICVLVDVVIDRIFSLAETDWSRKISHKKLRTSRDHLTFVAVRNHQTPPHSTYGEPMPLHGPSWPQWLPGTFGSRDRNVVTYQKCDGHVRMGNTALTNDQTWRHKACLVVGQRSISHPYVHVHFWYVTTFWSLEPNVTGSHWGHDGPCKGMGSP